MAADTAAAEQQVVPMGTPGQRTYWAYVERGTAAFSRPSRSARRVARLRTRTPEGTDEVVYVEARTKNGAPWYKVRTPALRRTGWVPRSRLGGLQTTSGYLVIDKAARQITFSKGGNVVMTASIGIGKADTPTPVGEFYVRTRLRGFSSPVYGPRAIGLSAKSRALTDWPGGGFIGIHGTNEPNLIPGAISHGCVRLRNQKILELYSLISVGTPVTIK